MTEVGGEEYLFVRLTGDHQLTIGEMSRGEGTVNAYLVCIICQLFLLMLRHTEAPTLLVIGGDLGDPVGLFRLGVDMLQEFFTTDLCVDGQGIAQHMEVTVLEVDDGLSLQVLNPTAPDIPLVGYGPVIDLCA